MVPADDQAIALPCTSVIVIIVLLNVALTCATPEAMFLRSRRRTRVASFPILNPFAERNRPFRCRHVILRNALFLLAGNRFGRTLAGACVGMGTLPAYPYQRTQRTHTNARTRKG